MGRRQEPEFSVGAAKGGTGGADDVVKTARSRNITDALKKAGGNPKYTEYPGVGHGCWDPAYQEKELFAWLFAQKLP